MRFRHGSPQQEGGSWVGQSVVAARMRGPTESLDTRVASSDEEGKKMKMKMNKNKECG